MDSEAVESKIGNRWEGMERRRSEGRIGTGLFLLIIGGLLFLRSSHLVIFPHWFFSSGMFFLALALFIGIKHRFRSGFWMIFLFIGGLSLLNEIDPTLRMDRYMWPLILMGIGIVFILRPKGRFGDRRSHRHDRWRNQLDQSAGYEAFEGSAPSTDRRDYIEATAVFGGVKKNILSKNFKGGEITSVMGGSEIDLTQADFTGTITIEVTTVFGGSKLVVPASWDVQNDISAVFGGVDDKRQISGVSMDPSKVLILEGTCVFGGIEIRSY